MSRTARALSVALAAGAVLALTGPAAQAGPRAAAVTAFCDPVTGTVLDVPSATSSAAPDGTPCGETGQEGVVRDGG
ncbi:hypothetical protein L0F81_30990, partial [Streptomyces tricolor]|nr:hypothetical protein [Streptomyces tricolor]